MILWESGREYLNIINVNTKVNYKSINEVETFGVIDTAVTDRFLKRIHLYGRVFYWLFISTDMFMI